MSTMENQPFSFENSVCPIPLTKHEKIMLGHGSGGGMTHDLIKNLFQPYFSNPSLNAGNDFAELPNIQNGRIVVSTDAHIVSPLFFPGGDIGRLAVCGTVNDVSMSGGIPLAITASFIIEEGFAFKDLERIILSMAQAASEAGVPIVAGDTKVVEKGKADGVFISTTGIASVSNMLNIAGDKAKPGDDVIISGTIGDHGIAVLIARGELGLSASIESDVAPLNHLIQESVQVCPAMHVLRDPTRGGLATTLNEIAIQSNVGILLNEENIPIVQQVRSTCEILGFDPLYVANEGKVILIAPPAYSAIILNTLKNNQYGKNVAIIGKITENDAGRVLLKTRVGTTRILDILSGEMLPRIC
jgi:hydrogenase expression/formation protein HypE